MQALGESLWADTVLYVYNKRVVFFSPKTDILEEVVSGRRCFKSRSAFASANMREAIDRVNRREGANIGKLERKRNVANNQLVVAGTRIPVANIKAFANEGYSVEQIKTEYPH